MCVLYIWFKKEKTQFLVGTFFCLMNKKTWFTASNFDENSGDKTDRKYIDINIVLPKMGIPILFERKK